MVLTLYKLDASPPARAVLMVIEALNIPDVVYANVNVFQQEHLKEDFVTLNPQHTVPTLVDDDFVLWDSHAITTYLINAYGENDSLYPSAPKQRALIDQRLHFDSGTLFPALAQAVVPVFYGGEKEFKPETLEKITKAYDVAEKFLATPWLAGDDATVADICCVATVSSMNEILAIDEATYPQLSDWLNRCSDQEFYKGNEPGLIQFREGIQIRLG